MNKKQIFIHLLDFQYNLLKKNFFPILNRSNFQSKETIRNLFDRASRDRHYNDLILQFG